MKANELMIGDWVLLWNKPQPQRVNYINLDDGERIGTDKQYLAQIVEAFEPIPLTPDILKKNGFDVSDREVMRYNFTLEEQKESFVLKQMYDKETKEPKGFSFFVCNVLTIFDYVHQLQHALRMVGLTELADNFRV